MNITVFSYLLLGVQHLMEASVSDFRKSILQQNLYPDFLLPENVFNKLAYRVVSN